MEVLWAMWAHDADIRHRDRDYGAVATVWRSYEIEYFEELPQTVDLLLVMRLDAGAEDFERQIPFDLAIVDEDGNSLGTLENMLEVPAGLAGMRSAWNMKLWLRGFEIPQEGEYALILNIDGQRKLVLSYYAVIDREFADREADDEVT